VVSPPPPVAVVPPPPPVSPPPPVNLGPLRNVTLNVVARQQQCAWMVADVSDDARVALEGFVGRDADREQLVGALRWLRPVQGVDDRRVTPDWPICDLLHDFRPAPASERVLLLNQEPAISVGPTPITNRHFRLQSESPAIRLWFRNQNDIANLRYARILVIGQDGWVSSPQSWAIEIPDQARSPMRVPEVQSSALVRVAGPAIVLAVLSETPLFASGRIFESVRQFTTGTFPLALRQQPNPPRTAFMIITFE
jgi:hypothetical protein